MRIVSCGTEHFEELINFVVRLNSEDAHHIGFFGEGEADVCSSIAECVIPPEVGFQLAFDEDQLVGVFGLDMNPEIGRAWLMGPLIEHEDWQILSDELYDICLACLKTFTDGISEQDLFCDVQNVNIKIFAERHDFPLHSENAVLTLERANYKKPLSFKGPFSIVGYGPEFFDQFEALHNSLFPKTYFTAGQIVEKIDAARRLFLGIENGVLKGYHFCKVESEAHLGYVDFIGVDGSVRGRGIGSRLFAEGLDWMLSFQETDKVNLTVNADNTSASKLYENFGFITDRVMRGYRKAVG